MSIFSETRSCIAQLRATHRGNQSTLKDELRKLMRSSLTRIRDMSTEERLDVRNKFTEEDINYLYSVSRTAAITSVREENPDLLYWGLLALIIEDCRWDYRDSLIELYLLNHSARKLDVRLKSLFDQFESVASDEQRDSWSRILAGDMPSIHQIHYVESTDKDGNFAYRQDW